MKAKAVLAATLAAALCAAPLAACNQGAGPVKVNGEPFELTDYATALPESSQPTKLAELKSMQTLDVLLTSLSWSGNSGESVQVARETGSGENAGKSRLFDLKSGTSFSEWYSDIDLVRSNAPFLLLTTAEGKYKIAYPTGEVITSTLFDNLYNFQTEWGYFPEGVAETYYALTYMEGTTETTVYVGFVNGEWKKLTAADVGGQGSGEYEVGDDLGVVKSPLAEANVGDADLYPDYVYKDYSFSSEGDRSAMTFTLYKGDEKLDSLTVFGGTDSVLGVVGSSFYYYERQAVSTDAKSGYNYEYPYGSSVEKYNMILHRYDFLKGKDSVVKTDYVFVTGSALYNRKTNDFDRLAVTAYRMKDGVAVASRGASEYRFILDEDARISSDMTGKNFSANFYRLSDDRYLSGRTIFDGEMNTVATLPTGSTPTVWEEQSLICFSASGSGYLAVDYDGKVAIAGLNSIRGVCGDSIVGTDREGTTALFSKNSPNGKKLSEVIGATVGYSQLSGTPLYYSVNYDTSVYTFYNTLGSEIGTFTAGSVSSLSSTVLSFGGNYYCSLPNASGSYVTLLFK